MTPTRLSKIARLPAHIREQLNHRLHDGELSRTIVPWVNELPETKKVLAELYRGKAITNQNLSEWRHTGYQDWLQHQQRLEWNSRLADEETEVNNQNRCEDGYEAMAFQFLYEIAQALKAMQKIKNPNQRWDRLETLTREFSRLQNAFNWSRRVCLEFDKFKLAHPGNQSDELESTSAPQVSSFCIVPSPSPEKRQGAGALQDAPRNSVVIEPRVSVSDCGSPLPLSNENFKPPAITSVVRETQESSEGQNSATSEIASPNSNLPSSVILSPSTPTTFQPLPTLAPPTPPPPIPNSYLRTPRPPLHSRRFVCIEG